jgi:hypothetical protein
MPANISFDQQSTSETHSNTTNQNNLLLLLFIIIHVCEFKICKRRYRYAYIGYALVKDWGNAEIS